MPIVAKVLKTLLQGPEHHNIKWLENMGGIWAQQPGEDPPFLKIYILYLVCKTSPKVLLDPRKSATVLMNSDE